MKNIEYNIGDILKTYKGDYVYIGEHTPVKRTMLDMFGNFSYKALKNEKLFIKLLNGKIQKTPRNILEIVKDTKIYDDILNGTFKFEKRKTYNGDFEDLYFSVESIEFAIKHNQRYYQVYMFSKKNDKEYLSFRDENDYGKVVSNLGDGLISVQSLRPNFQEYSFKIYLQSLKK